MQWKQCRTCEQDFTGDMQLGLAEAHWEVVRGLAAEEAERLFAMGELARALQDCLGDYEAALPLLEECLAVTRRMVGDQHPNTLATIGNLADLHRAMGHLEQALALGTEALAVAEQGRIKRARRLVLRAVCLLELRGPGGKTVGAHAGGTTSLGGAE